MSVIKKKGNKWVVVSESSGRELGTYNSKEEAVQRLRQVEYFKAHPSKSKSETKDMSSYNERLMLEVAKQQRKLDPNAGVRNRGNVVFPANSKKVKDHKDHFPINNADQARNALSRVGQYSSVPPWYSGSLSELKSAVQGAVKRKYPKIGVTKAFELPNVVVKNPNTQKGKVAPVPVPSLKNIGGDAGKSYAAYSKLSAVQRKLLASQLMDQLNKQKETIDKALELANKLESGGLDAEEFQDLNTFTQQDILMQLLSKMKD